jgi:hypothetical protein
MTRNIEFLWSLVDLTGNLLVLGIGSLTIVTFSIVLLNYLNPEESS